MLPLASLSNRCRDSINCSGDKSSGDLMCNNYLECNAASGFSQQPLQGFDGLICDADPVDFSYLVTHVQRGLKSRDYRL